MVKLGIRITRTQDALGKKSITSSFAPLAVLENMLGMGTWGDDEIIAGGKALHTRPSARPLPVDASRITCNRIIEFRIWVS